MKKFRLKSISILMASAIMLSACGSAGVDNTAAETVEMAEEAADNDETEVDSDSDKVEVSEDDTTAETADSDAEESEENGIRPFTIDGITHGIGDGWIEYDLTQEESDILNEIITLSESGDYDSMYDLILSEELANIDTRYRLNGHYMPQTIYFEEKYKIYLSASKSDDFGDDATLIMTPIDSGQGYYYAGSKRDGEDGIINHSYEYGICPCINGTFEGEAEYYEHSWRDVPEDYAASNPGKDFTLEAKTIENGLMRNGLKDDKWKRTYDAVGFSSSIFTETYHTEEFYDNGHIEIIYQDTIEVENIETGDYESEVRNFYSRYVDENGSPTTDILGNEYDEWVGDDNLDWLYTFDGPYLWYESYLNGYADEHTIPF